MRVGDSRDLLTAFAAFTKFATSGECSATVRVPKVVSPDPLGTLGRLSAELIDAEGTSELSQAWKTPVSISARDSARK